MSLWMGGWVGGDQHFIVVGKAEVVESSHSALC